MTNECLEYYFAAMIAGPSLTWR